MSEPSAPKPKSKRPISRGRKPAARPEDRELTLRQKTFADEYLIPGTTIEVAAVKAGYSPKTAESQGAQVLRLPHVKKYIAERQAILQNKHNVTLDRVIQEFAKIAFSNMADYIEDDGEGRPRFKSIATISKKKMAVVTELTIDTRKEFEGFGADRTHVANVEKVRFKLADKVAALTSLGKHLGMFPKDEGGDGDGNITVTVKVEGGLPSPGTVPEVVPPPLPPDPEFDDVVTEPKVGTE